MSVESENRGQKVIGRRRYLLATVVFVVLTLIVMAGLFSHSLGYLKYAPPLDDGEGFVTNQAKLLSEGISPYDPITREPYIVTNYPPVFIGLLAILVKFAGVKLTLGRFISVLSGIIVLLIVFFSSRKQSGRSLISSLIGPAILAATPVIYFWMPLCRVDMFANMLSLAAVYLFARYPDKKGIHLALPFLLLALFTRQSAIEGFLVIGIIIYLKNKKDILYFAGLYILGSAIILAICHLLYGVEFFRHIITYTRTQWYLVRLIGTFELVFENMLLPTLLAIFASVKLWRTENRIWVIYFIVGFLMAFLSGKVGSAQNYFLPMFIPQAVVIGIWASDMLSSKGVPTVLKSALMAGMALLIAYMGLATGNRFHAFKPNDISVYHAGQFLEIVSKFEDPVFIEDEGLTLLSGRDVIYTPFIMNELSKEGLWDQSDFLAKFESAEFELVILRFDVFDPDHEDRHELGDMAGWDRFSPEMEEAIRKNYVSDGNSLPMRRQWYFYTRRSEGPPKIQLVFK